MHALLYRGVSTLLLSIGLGACGVSTRLVRRGPPCPPRPASCEFEIVHQRPAHDYAVIAVIELAAFSVRSLPLMDDELREAVAPDVCRAGGDAVLPGVDGDGRYVLATVLKWTAEGSDNAACAVTSPHTQGPSSDSASASMPKISALRTVAICDGGASCWSR